MIWKNWINFLVILCISVGLSSCYSFKGASLDPNLKTLQVSNIRMETAGGPANLSLEINEKLKEYFQRNTSLKINNKNPDLTIEGSITGY